MKLNTPSPEKEPEYMGQISDPKPDLQKNLFSIWFQSTVINGPKRRAYKVPSRIQWLPCGCCRERTPEGEVNSTWHIKRKKNKYSHKECGRSLN